MAIDLGTSTVVVAVGSKSEESQLKIEAVVSKPSAGVNAGRIENIELVSKAIKDAVAEVETRLGIHITEAYAGISGEFVRCARHTDHVFTDDPQNGVNQKDMAALFDRMRNVQAQDDETIMERIPQSYIVDDTQEVENPVGCFAKHLTSTFNFILCGNVPMQRLEMAMRRVGIKMLAIYANTLVTGEAVLSTDEKTEGVAVVNIGGGVTDVTVYYRNVVRYIASIPIGASAINQDIRSLVIPEKYIEKLKLNYGSAVAELVTESKMVRVKGRTAREDKDILLRNLSTVIEARVMDIAEFVVQEIKDSGCAGKLPYGIVLTGGSAQLKDIDELFRRVSGMDVRIAAPDVEVSEDVGEAEMTPAVATVVGLLMKGMEKGEGSVAKMVVPKPAVTSPFVNGASKSVAPAQSKYASQMPKYDPDKLAKDDAAVDDDEQDDDDDDEQEDEYAPKRKRGIGGIFERVKNKINKTFDAAADDEI